MNLSERFSGCILCGAIGDAMGSSHENTFLSNVNDTQTFYPYGKPQQKEPLWKVTDDTQLTLATCEVIIENKTFKIENYTKKYLDYFLKNKISGIGSSTLKALQELQAGGHWSLVGRRGEYAAGNGAAMRMAPLAFVDGISREQIRNLSIITHNNDEAYVGALCVILAIRAILDNSWTGKECLIEFLIDHIPDTKLRDRLIKIRTIEDLLEVGTLGNSGYVVDSIPLAIAAANKVLKIGVSKMYAQLMQIGGDTDTNASIAGQIVGTLIGRNNIPKSLFNQLRTLKDYPWIDNTINQFIDRKWR